MRLLAQYIHLNLWLAVCWILLLTYDGTLVPSMGTLLAFTAFVGIANVGKVEKALFGRTISSDE